MSSGGAGGLLFAQLFKCIGKVAGPTDVSLEELGNGLAQAAAQISRLGRTQMGDKTMIDALGPAVDALAAGGDLMAAASAAEDGAEATRDMTATQGRARYVPDGGRGHVDPGARSVVLIVEKGKADAQHDAGALAIGGIVTLPYQPSDLLRSLRIARHAQAG